MIKSVCFFCWWCHVVVAVAVVAAAAVAAAVSPFAGFVNDEVRGRDDSAPLP